MTLIELLVVVAVIGVLSATGFARWIQYRRQAVDAQMRASLSAARYAMEGFFDDNDNSYANAQELDLDDYGYRDTVGVGINIVSAGPTDYVLRTCASGGSFSAFELDSRTATIVGVSGTCFPKRARGGKGKKKG
ncbi:MAG: hypothetical protein QOD06_2304 [Candidatus Binatota bacterium]|jgi:prepilin-type N-terminal cleavage/methylation domain-containing protein|nr:hypothetical protein [Candidatus Binatota bacterium]